MKKIKKTIKVLFNALILCIGSNAYVAEGAECKPCADGTADYAGPDLCGNQVCEAEMQNSYTYSDACGKGVCEQPDPEAFCCDGTLMASEAACCRYRNALAREKCKKAANDEHTKKFAEITKTKETADKEALDKLEAAKTLFEDTITQIAQDTCEYDKGAGKCTAPDLAYYRILVANGLQGAGPQAAIKAAEVLFAGRMKLNALNAERNKENIDDKLVEDKSDCESQNDDSNC